MNSNCNNYNQELDERVEICSLCNEPVTKTESKINSRFQLISIITAITGFVLSLWGFTWFMAILGFAGVFASVVIGFMSRSKAAVIISLLSVIASAAVFIYFIFLI